MFTTPITARGVKRTQGSMTPSAITRSSIQSTPVLSPLNTSLPLPSSPVSKAPKPNHFLSIEPYITLPPTISKYISEQNIDASRITIHCDELGYCFTVIDKRTILLWKISTSDEDKSFLLQLQSEYNIRAQLCTTLRGEDGNVTGVLTVTEEGHVQRFINGTADRADSILGANVRIQCMERLDNHRFLLGGNGGSLYNLKFDANKVEVLPVQEAQAGIFAFRLFSSTQKFNLSSMNITGMKVTQTDANQWDVILKGEEGLRKLALSSLNYTNKWEYLVKNVMRDRKGGNSEDYRVVDFTCSENGRDVSVLVENSDNDSMDPKLIGFTVLQVKAEDQAQPTTIGSRDINSSSVVAPIKYDASIRGRLFSSKEISTRFFAVWNNLLFTADMRDTSLTEVVRDQYWGAFEMNETIYVVTNSGVFTLRPTTTSHVRPTPQSRQAKPDVDLDSLSSVFRSYLHDKNNFPQPSRAAKTEENVLSLANELVNYTKTRNIHWAESNQDHAASALLDGHLQDKQRTFSSLFDFLDTIGASVSNDMQNQLHILQDKLQAALRLRTQSNGPEASAALQDILKSSFSQLYDSRHHRDIEPGRTIQDYYYWEVSRMEGLLPCVVEIIEEREEADFDQLIEYLLAANEVFLCFCHTFSSVTMNSQISETDQRLGRPELVRELLKRYFKMVESISSKTDQFHAAGESKSSKIYQQMSVIANTILTACDDSQGSTRDDLESNKCELIDFFFREADNPTARDAAFRLAEKWSNFDILIGLCVGDDERMRHYLFSFRHQGFHQKLFTFYVQNNMTDRLLSVPREFSGELDRYLEDRPDLSWIHDFSMKEYRKAAYTTLQEAQSETGSVERKKILLHISRLAALATGTGADQKLIPEAEELRYRAQNQLDMLEIQRVKFAEISRPLSPHDLISQLMTGHVTSSNVIDSLNVWSDLPREAGRDVTLTSIWQAALAADDWESVVEIDSDDKLKERFRESVFYQSASAIKANQKVYEQDPLAPLVIGNALSGYLQSLGGKKQASVDRIIRTCYEMINSEP
ncbi:nuclear pore complex protein [Planoprotostelium fungivorum]|uniref:Nuclear pore complex protein n=1 Tax=Planoprotostelium fungivorum TaxID=1890364 RepID=A0A2P6NX88_9EUKA|nr:nuclear pore complex protein [Planoprotostelium fungivorum]